MLQDIVVLAQLLAIPTVVPFIMETSNLYNIKPMEKHPKIIKRQRARLTEPKIDSTPMSESSFTGAEPPAQSAEPAPLEQFFESMEPYSPTESLPAVDRQPLPYYPAVFQWKEELREIRYESDFDVWDSCPYD